MAWGHSGRFNDSERTNRSSAAALCMVALFVMSAIGGLSVNASDSEPGPENGGTEPEPQNEPDGGPEPAAPPAPRVIGTYFIDNQWLELTERYAHSAGDKLKIRAPPRAEAMRLDPDFIKDQIGPWSAKGRFSISAEDGFVGVERRAIVFVPLALDDRSSFTMGSNSTIRFSDRPMTIQLTKAGQEVILELDDGDTSGQSVFVSKTFLHKYGIHRPYAVHGDGTALPVTSSEDRSGFWVEMPHFSELVLGPSDIKVLGRNAIGLPFAHSGTVTWNTTSDQLFIEVGNKLSTYSVLVETDWFEAHMSNTSLKDRAWTIEEYQGASYYVVTLPSSQTPTTLEFLDFRPSQDLLYTYGGLNYFESYAYNETVKASKGPMWVQTTVSDQFVEVTIDSVLDEDLEIAFSGEWLESLYPEHVVFADASGQLVPSGPLVDGNIVVTVLDTLNLRIWNSTAGPLIPPRYENVDGGVVKRTDGCRILHTVVVNNSSLQYEAPACWHADDVQNLTSQVNETYWLYDTPLLLACSIFVDRGPGPSAAVVAPCTDSVDVQGQLPGFVNNLCSTVEWGNKSHAAFCDVGLTRFHAAGIPLNVTNETIGVAMSAILHMNDPLASSINTALANATLQAEWEWAEAADEMIRSVQLEGACANGTAFLLLHRWMPDEVCGRSFTTWMENNTTRQVDPVAMWQAWSTMRDSLECPNGRQPLILLDGAPTTGCGRTVPRLNNITARAAAEIDWGTECADGKPLVFFGQGTNASHSWTCGVILDPPTNQSVQTAWNDTRNWGPCLGELMFVLDPAGDAPHALCGESAVSLKPAADAVFDYVMSVHTCGNQTPLMMVNNRSADMVVVCGTSVVGGDAGWDDAWDELRAINPCGGQVAFANGSYVKGIHDAQLQYDENASVVMRLCGADFADPLGSFQYVVADDEYSPGVPGAPGGPELPDCVSDEIVALTNSKLVSVCTIEIDPCGETCAPPDPGDPCQSACDPPLPEDLPCGDGIDVGEGHETGAEPNPDMPLTVCGEEIDIGDYAGPVLDEIWDLINTIEDELDDVDCSSLPEAVFTVPIHVSSTLCGIEVGDIGELIPDLEDEIDEIMDYIADQNPCGDVEALMIQWAYGPVMACIDFIGGFVPDDVDIPGMCDAAPAVCDPPELPSIPTVPQVCFGCFNYTLDDVDSGSAQLGLPAVFADGSVLWLVGAPIVGVNTGEGHPQGIWIANAGFAGSFSAIMSNTPGSPEEYTARVYHVDGQSGNEEQEGSVEVPWFNVTIEGTRADLDGAASTVASVNAHMVLPNEVHPELGEGTTGEVSEALGESALQAILDFSVMTTELYEEVKVRAKTAGMDASLSQGKDTNEPGQPVPLPETAVKRPSLGWVLQLVGEEAHVDDVGEDEVNPLEGTVMTPVWHTLVQRTGSVSLEWRGGDSLSLTFNPMPRVLAEANVTFVAGDTDTGADAWYAALHWPSGEQLDGISVHVLGADLRLLRPPDGFSFDLLNHGTTLSLLEAQAWRARMVAEEEGGLSPELDGGDSMAIEMRVGEDNEPGSTRLDVDGLSKNLYAKVTFVDSDTMEGHSAIIPFVKALIFDQTNPSNSTEFVSKVAFRVFGMLEVVVEHVSFVDIDTSKNGAYEDEQYDVRFHSPGAGLSIWYNGVIADQEMILKVSIFAPCEHLVGTMYFSSWSDSNGAVGYDVHHGRLSFDISDRCGVSRYALATVVSGVSRQAIYLQNIESLDADYDMRFSFCGEDDGSEVYIDAAATFGSGGQLKVDLNRFDVDLTANMDLLEKLDLDVALEDGYQTSDEFECLSYGTFAERDVDLGWWINEASNGLSLRFEGEDSGFEMNDMEPTGSVDKGDWNVFGFLGSLLCNEGNLEVGRNGDHQYRCEQPGPDVFDFYTMP